MIRARCDMCGVQLVHGKRSVQVDITPMVTMRDGHLEPVGTGEVKNYCEPCSDNQPEVFR